jgi:serine/threonine-protein kinase
VVLALLLIGVGSVGLLLLRAERQTTAGPSQKPKPPTNAAPATAAAPAVPVVLLGADCATLGGAGVTSDGAQAYCSRLPNTGDPVWSLYTQVPTPSAATPGPTDVVYPEGIEEQVEVCVEETHRTRLQCREDIRRGNITGPG